MFVSATLANPYGEANILKSEYLSVIQGFYYYFKKRISIQNNFYGIFSMSIWHFIYCLIHESNWKQTNDCTMYGTPG